MSDAEKAVALFANIISDDELAHLKVKDVKKMMFHFEAFLNEEDEVEEAAEDDLNRYIL